jgi:hypothetical protein
MASLRTPAIPSTGILSARTDHTDSDKPDVRQIPLDQIRDDGGTQARVGIPNEGAVDDYREHLDQLPPADVFFDGADYWLADGFHRYLAHHEENRATMLCCVHRGGQRDALLYAIGANAGHGLRRSNADKRNAVELLLDDEQWSKNSDRWIAKAAGVTQPFVSRVRKELFGEPRANEKPVEELDCPGSDNGYHPGDRDDTVELAGKGPQEWAEHEGEDLDPIQAAANDASAADEPSQPWANYNAKVRRVVEHLREALRTVETMVDPTATTPKEREFAEDWMGTGAVQWRQTFAKLIADFNKREVTQWASERQAKELGRNFLYVFEGKQSAKPRREAKCK